jgi:cytosine/adenosine deaminase-related metal-dependent hydrolase
VSLVISGRIVPLARTSEKSTFAGKVWIGDDGRIERVTRGNAAGPRSGFDKAAVVDVGDDLVLPGFVDLHSHLAYATLPLWTQPGRTTPFLHRDSWPSASTYASDITWPAYALLTAAPEASLAYAEVRALIGGTTSIQGSPPKNRPLDGWMVRNVEDETFGGTISSNRVLASTLTVKPEVLAKRSAQMKAGAGFIYHCAEGQVSSIAANEYQSARKCGCLQKDFVAIHTNALNPGDYDAWTDPGTVVWSPFSNLWLYGSTTSVPSALARKIRVCVGSDWGPSGTRNVLGEIKVAALVSKRERWNLTPFDLVRMITCEPGDAIAGPWNVQAGRLELNALGDVVVIAAKASADPFATVLAATENDVQLVVIGARARYGNAKLMKAAKATFPSELKIAGTKRVLSMTKLDNASEPWSFAQVLTRLEQVRADPKKEIDAAGNAAAAARMAGEAPRLRLALDMPLGKLPIGGLPKNLGEIVVPPIQPLAHDAAFFASLVGRGFHGGLLDGLKKFYA